MANKAISLEQMSRIWGKVKNYVAASISGLYTKPSGGIPKSDLSTDVQTSLGKADTALQTFTESDPTVPSWAKQSSKPTYTAQEVGALPSSTPIPTKTSDLTNDSGFLTQHQSLKTIGGNAITGSGNIPWPTYTANDTGALPNTTTLADLPDDSTHRTVSDAEKTTWNGKQDAINDLADIRSGAALGATALQEHQELKTINNQSLLGSGNITIDTGSVYQIRVSLINPIFKEALYRGAICFKYSDTEWLPSSRELGYNTDKELTTLDFDPFGQIFYYGSSTTIPVGTSVNAAYLYQQYGFDFRYAFNAGSTLTPYKAVYVKCEPLVDGSNNRTGRVRLASQPIVQDLPTTADGFVYIYLGQATSERNIFILLNHPVYEYRNGGIKLWIGD